MKKSDLFNAFNEIKPQSNMEERVMNNCKKKFKKSNFIIIPRRMIAVFSAIMVLCLTTVYAIAAGIITISIPGSDFSKNTDYVVELQKNSIILDDNVKKEITKFYTDFTNDSQVKKSFDSFSDARSFLGIELLDNALYLNSKDAVSLEAYGSKDEPNRIKLVSYQTTVDFPTPFPVTAEFALNNEGNFSEIIASSSEANKKTNLKTYHSKKSDITTQIAITNNKETSSYDAEIYFVHENVLYNCSILFDNNISINTIMKNIKTLIDGFFE